MHGQDEGERLGPIFSQGKSSPVLLTDTGEPVIYYFYIDPKYKFRILDHTL